MTDTASFLGSLAGGVLAALVVLYGRREPAWMGRLVRAFAVFCVVVAIAGVLGAYPRRRRSLVA